MSVPLSRRWIVGHDGSDGSATAAKWTLAQARGRDVDVVFVRAWTFPALEYPLPGESMHDIAPDAACDDLDDLVALGATAGTSVSSSLVMGGPARVLLEASEEASLLVVGSRGLGGFRRLLVGSVGSQCATHSRVPTVVVPASSDVDRSVHQIVVGVDGSDRSLAALAWARSFAPGDAQIVAVGAWRESRSGYVAVVQEYGHEFEHERDQFHEMLDRFETDTPGGQVLERKFVHADPARALLAEASGADLLVVGERGHAGLSAAILGSVTTHVIHHSEIPVAVVPTVSQ